MKSMKKVGGFSLIELMIVVGIIGILATIAVPKMQSFRSRAMKTEANMILGNVATLQQAYSLENSAYIGYGATEWYGRTPTVAGAGNACAPVAAVKTANSLLGFEIEPCDTKSPRYGYNIVLTAGGFEAVADSGKSGNNLIFPGCDTPDIFKIDQTRSINNSKAINACP